MDQIFIQYIPGPENIVAGALSRLPMDNKNNDVQEMYDAHIQKKRKICARTQFVPDECPLDIKLITRTQRDELKRKSTKLKEYVRDPKSAYTRTNFYDNEVILFKNKIYIPIVLRKQILNWYHLYLCHPGGTRLGKTIQQSCDWPGLISQAALFAKRCTTCQRFKKSGTLKYGKFPLN